MRRRVLVRGLIGLVVALLLGYGAIRCYVVYQAYRGAQLLESLSRIRIGDSEQSVLPLTQSYTLWKASDPGDPMDTYGYVLVVSPWFPVRNHAHSYYWVTDALIRYVPVGMRQRIGLREFDAAGRIQVRQGRVIAVWAELEVEGRDGLLKAEWELLAAVPAYRLYGSRGEPPPSHFHIAHLHYGHPVYGVWHGWAIETSITPQASDADVTAAHNINLKCMTSFRGCSALEDLAPDAARRIGR